MRIAMAQINPILGNFSYNAQKILDFTNRAKKENCDLIIFPEASLFGYSPMDLLERKSIVHAQLKEFYKLRNKLPKNIFVLFGLFVFNTKKKGKPFFNSAALVQKGKKTLFFHKELLPSYDVFDESRHIESGDISKNLIKIKGLNCLVSICEDIWAWPYKKEKSKYYYNPLHKLKKKNIDLVINISASPFSETKFLLRKYMLFKTSQYLKSPIIYLNMVGGQDELIFDGGSMVFNHQGGIIKLGNFFQEEMQILDSSEFEITSNKLDKYKKNYFDQENKIINKNIKEKIKLIEDDKLSICHIHQALQLGIKDFIHKCGFKKVHLGLSGGIDSAVVATLAVEALGNDHVTGIFLKGPYSTKKSFSLASKLAKNLKIDFFDISINGVYETVISLLRQTIKVEKFSIVHENIQTRIRGMLLMAYANHTHSLLLNTGNKSEYATGYVTLYGDMCGGLSPIGDLLKGKVYNLACEINKTKEIIPKEIISRSPSAELRFNQKDEDTLPAYDELDKSIYNLIEKFNPFKTETDKWVINSLMKTEFKRWQAPPILKVTLHAFGRGRRLPIAHRAKC